MEGVWLRRCDGVEYGVSGGWRRTRHHRHHLKSLQSVAARTQRSTAGAGAGAGVRAACSRCWAAAGWAGAWRDGPGRCAAPREPECARIQERRHGPRYVCTGGLSPRRLRGPRVPRPSVSCARRGPRRVRQRVWIMSRQCLGSVHMFRKIEEKSDDGRVGNEGGGA